MVTYYSNYDPILIEIDQIIFFVFVKKGDIKSICGWFKWLPIKL